MARSIYITSSEGDTGKSTVALGMVDLLTRTVQRLGVFRPIAPADEIAQRMVGLSDGLSFRSAVGYTGMQVQRVRELLVSFAAEQLGVPAEALAER